MLWMFWQINIGNFRSDFCQHLGTCNNTRAHNVFEWYSFETQQIF